MKFDLCTGLVEYGLLNLKIFCDYWSLPYLLMAICLSLLIWRISCGTKRILCGTKRISCGRVDNYWLNILKSRYTNVWSQTYNQYDVGIGIKPYTNKHKTWIKCVLFDKNLDMFKQFGNKYINLDQKLRHVQTVW